MGRELPLLTQQGVSTKCDNRAKGGIVISDQLGRAAAPGDCGGTQSESHQATNNWSLQAGAVCLGLEPPIPPSISADTHWGAEPSDAVQNPNGLTIHSYAPFSHLAVFPQCLLCCRLTAGYCSCRPAPAAQFPEGYGALKQSRTCPVPPGCSAGPP